MSLRPIDQCKAAVEAWIVGVLDELAQGRLVTVPESVATLLDRFPPGRGAREWRGALVATVDEVMERSIDPTLPRHDYPIDSRAVADAIAWAEPSDAASRPPSQDASRFAWLFAFGSVPEACADVEELERAWTTAGRALQVVARTGPRLLQWADPAATQLRSQIEDGVAAARWYATIQGEIAALIGRELDARGIAHAFLKGSAVATIYPVPFLRQGHDIDFGVRREDLSATVDILVEHGFCPAELGWNGHRAVYRRANPLRRLLEERKHHYELGMLVKSLRPTSVDPEIEAAARRACAHSEPIGWYIDDDDQLSCHVSVDVHYGISGPIPMQPLLATARTVAGRRIPALDWMMFHAISKLYFEGVRSYGVAVHHYSDLLRMLAVASEADIQRLTQWIEKEGFGVPAYYVLRRLESDLGTSLPDALRRQTESNATPEAYGDANAVHDHGDMWPKLWVSR